MPAKRFLLFDTGDLFVVVDNVLQVQGSQYTVQNLTQAGGDVVFTEAPAADLLVRIIRRTDITQQIALFGAGPIGPSGKSCQVCPSPVGVGSGSCW